MSVNKCTSCKYEESCWHYNAVQVAAMNICKAAYCHDNNVSLIDIDTDEKAINVICEEYDKMILKVQELMASKCKKYKAKCNG